MKFYMNINDLIGWILILGFVIFFVVVWIAASVVERIDNFKSRREKKKREREANGE